jgi:tetratricopeptide (TPR) repeat protein
MGRPRIRHPASPATSASRRAARAGDLGKALAHAFIAVKQEPRSFDALFLLASSLHNLGRTEEAIPYYRRAIDANDALPVPHHNFGCALLALGRTAEATVVLQRALDLRPDYAPTLDALGFAMAETGHPEEAALLWERALALDAGLAAVHSRLGHVLLRLQRFPEAAERFAAGLELEPKSSELLCGLGVALDRLGRTEESIERFRAAVASDPKNAIAASNLGRKLFEIGDVEEGLRCLDRAIESEPRNGSLYLPLVTGGPMGIKPEHVAAMIRLESDLETLPRSQQIDLHFALGNVYERDGRVDDAFHHLLAGNALKRAEVPYDEATALGYLHSVEVAFGNPMMEALRGCGDPSERPIFIVGMPRSGSTLVEQLLAAHPSVAGGGECGVLLPIVRDRWPKMSALTVEQLHARVRAIGEHYLRATDDLTSGKPYLTDKTLEYFQIVPLIHVALPNARIIHIRRNDLDACFSCFATIFSDQKVPFSYDLRELGHYYRAYLAMMERWSSFVRSDRMLEVRYEGLIADFDAEARRIVAFCGLTWDSACLRFHQARRTVRTASHLQVRQPLYNTSIGRAQPFIAHLAPLIEALAGAH